MNAEESQLFWSKVDKNGPVVRPELSNCWIWTASKRSGYGAFGIKRRIQQAHRLSYEQVHGQVPYLLRHRCDNKACVRPDHMEPGTHKDNAEDMSKRNPNVHILNEDQVIKARRLAAGGKSISLIMKDLQITNRQALMSAIQGKTFSYLAGALDLNDIYRPIFGKLTEEQYAEIFEELKSPYRGQGRHLAVKYGVHPSLITHIKNGKIKSIKNVSYDEH